jgi:alpha-N-arabinofuranosidase
MPLLLRIAFAGKGTVWLDQVFLFPADHVDGFDPDVVRLWREARPPLLRFPGGNFSSGYHWKDGIGPVDRRPTLPSPAWPIAEYNHVGTDEMMKFCMAIGCEPLICVNAGDGTPEEAAEWIEYCNRGTETRYGALRDENGNPAPYYVRYWEIGNELYGRWQIGHCSAREYAARYVRFVRAMRKVDPNILFIANGHSQEWNAEVAKRKPELLRSLSVHTLVGGGTPGDADPADTFQALMAHAHAYPDLLGQLAAPMRRAGLRPRLAITERSALDRIHHERGHSVTGDG